MDCVHVTNKDDIRLTKRNIKSHPSSTLVSHNSSVNALRTLHFMGFCSRQPTKERIVSVAPQMGQ